MKIRRFLKNIRVIALEDFLYSKTTKSHKNRNLPIFIISKQMSDENWNKNRTITRAGRKQKYNKNINVQVLLKEYFNYYLLSKLLSKATLNNETINKISANFKFFNNTIEIKESISCRIVDGNTYLKPR